MNNNTKVVPAFAQRLANQFDDSVIAKINGYIAKTRQLEKVDETTVVNFLQDMVDGMNEVTAAIAAVSVRLSEAELNFDQAESIAALDLFPLYVAERKIKGTADERNYFVQRDGEVRKYKEEKLYWKSVLEYLKGIARNLDHAHTDARICNRPGQSSNLSKPIMGGSEEPPAYEFDYR